MIVDAHVHIYKEINGRIKNGTTHDLGYGCVCADNSIIQVLPPFYKKTQFTVEMLIAQMEWAKVDKSVLLQGPFYGECNAYIIDAVKHYPDRFIGMAYFDPWGYNSRAKFNNIVDSNTFCGIKIEFSEATGYSGIYDNVSLYSDDTNWLWDKMEKLNLTLVLDLGSVGSCSYQTEDVYKIAYIHKNLKIVIAHLAQPSPMIEKSQLMYSKWLEQIELGLLPNVFFETAALPAYYTDEDYPYPSAKKYIKTVIGKIGSHKIMWATDIPGLFINATYPQLVKMGKIHTDFLPPEEQALVLGGNALRVFSKHNS